MLIHSSPHGSLPQLWGLRWLSDDLGAAEPPQGATRVVGGRI